MLTATNQTNRRPLTNRLAIAIILATGLLAGCVPAAAQATEVPTGSASAAEVVTVGAGTLISLEDAVIRDEPNARAAIVGNMAPGETATWHELGGSGSPAQYRITADLGTEGWVEETRVVAIPKAGLKLDQAIVIVSAAGKKDVTSGWGGKLDATAMTVRAAPSLDAAVAVLSKIQEGQKFAQASAPILGQSSMVGASSWVAVLLDPETKSFGWIHSAAIAKDPNPGGAEVLVTNEPSSEPSEDEEPTNEDAESPASVTPAPVATEPAPAEEPAPEADNSNPGTLFLVGAGGLVTGILLGAGLATALRKKTDNEPGDKADNAPTKHTETVADEVAGDEDADETPATETDDAEDIDWEAEEV